MLPMAQKPWDFRHFSPPRRSESSIAHPISEQKRGCLSQRITDRYSFEAEEELLREATPAALAMG